jgi:hypothetical protein
MNLNENISRVKGLMGIISENRNPWLMRRIGEIHEFVKLALRRVPAGGYSYHDYVDENVSNIDDLLDFVRDNYWKEIEEVYLKSTDN